MRLDSKVAVAVVLVGLMLAMPVSTGAAGQSFTDSGTMRQVVLGTGSGLVSFVYSPVKFLYACGATGTGGLILAFTGGKGTETASVVVQQGIRGDWWVHPDVFTGHHRLQFIGKPE